jgi:cysteine desulfuration protein SufE
MTVAERQAELIGEYRIIEHALERFQVILETVPARALPYPEEYRNADHLVPGCTSAVWLAVWELSPDCWAVRIAADTPSLAAIGALFSMIYDGGRGEEIRSVEPEFLAALGIDRQLTPTRLRGLGFLRAKLVEATMAATTLGNA